MPLLLLWTPLLDFFLVLFPLPFLGSLMAILLESGDFLFFSKIKVKGLLFLLFFSPLVYISLLLLLFSFLPLCSGGRNFELVSCSFSSSGLVWVNRDE